MSGLTVDNALPIQRAWARPSDYLRDTASHGSLAWRLARFQLTADLSHTGLGLLWLAVAPALVAIPGVLIFGYVLEIDRGVEHYPLFATVGLVAFRQLSRTWTRAVGAYRARGLGNVPPGVPAAVGVIAYAIQEAFAAFVALFLLTIWGVLIGAVSLLALLGVALTVAVGAALSASYGVLAAGVTKRWDDLAEIFPHAIRALGHASGIWYLPSLYVAGRWFEPAFDWNPISVAIELARVTALGYPLRPILILSAVANIIVPALVGCGLLWRSENVVS